MRTLAAVLPVLLLASVPVLAQEARGSLTANGKTAALKHAIAIEVDSTTERGFMDVVVVLSDRKLTREQAVDAARLEEMARRDGLAGLRVVLNPDAKVMSAEPLHPAFTAFVSSALWVRWQPTAYDEKKVAGRFHSDGTRSEFKQTWSYDLNFSAPIELDPQAKTRR